MVLQTKSLENNSEAATLIHAATVKIAGQNYIAPEDAVPMHATGTINGIYEPGCELFKKRIECAIMMKIAEEEI